MPPTSTLSLDSTPLASTGRSSSLNTNTIHPTARDRSPLTNSSLGGSPLIPLRSGLALTQPESLQPESSPRAIPSQGERMILPFDQLHCFEDVADRFADFGLHFHNAIALIPSNPSYPTAKSALMIVSAPYNGALEIQFDRPISSLTACVTSSRPMTMSAKNKDAAIIARSRIPSGNLSGSNSGIPANYPLVVIAPAIYGVTFSAFDGQIAIGDLSFSWAADSTQN